MSERSEVEAINRRKFLAELSRLLTFMYEEDRQLALSFYERMFDAAEDEQALIQGLMSPTRQAVLIARAYDAKERRLSVSSHSKEEDGYQESEETPQFVLVINQVFKDIFPDDVPAQEFVEAQISLFDEEREEPGNFADEYFGGKKTDEPGREPEEASSPIPAKPLKDTQEFAPVEKPKAEEPAEDEAPETAAEEATPTENAGLVDKETQTEAGTETELRPQPEEDVQPESVSEQTPDESPASEKEDSLLASLGLDDGFRFSRSTEPAHLSSEAILPEDKTIPQEKAAGIQETGISAGKEAEPKRKKPQRRRQQVTERRAILPLQVLFWIVAFPVTLAVLALLLALTLAGLSVSLGLIVVGAVLLISAFSGFAVLADILLILGSALVSLAFGLLFLWLVIWIAGGVIPDLFRWVLERNGEWCYKEVPAE